MIIKFFHQGKNVGDYIVQYLLSEDKHNGMKPEVIEGSPELTLNIINSLKFKNKYTTGVISFKEGEQLTRQQQHELIQQFESTFCPFDDPARVSFLWVKHEDKGRLELHFLMPRVDLKTGKSFNIHPPGKSNLLFYEAFTRLENKKHGFEQVDGKKMGSKNVQFYIDVLNDLHLQRKDYIYSQYDKPKTIKTKGFKNGRTRITGTKSVSHKFNGKYAQFRNCANSIKFKIESSRVVQSRIGQKPNRNEGSLWKDGSATQGVESFARTASNAVETVAKLSGGFGFSSQQERGSKPSRSTPKQGLSLEAEILALAIELNHCEPWEAAAIKDRLDYLQGEKSRLGYVDPLSKSGPSSRPKPR
jgi:hypothetical protein